MNVIVGGKLILQDRVVVGAALTTDVTCELIVDTFHVWPTLYDML